jgi:hypothetical protein
MKSFCIIKVKYYPKQQYIILFQENFISGVYLFQVDRYSIFQTGQDFWRALYHSQGLLFEFLNKVKKLPSLMFMSIFHVKCPYPFFLLNVHVHSAIHLHGLGHGKRTEMATAQSWTQSWAWSWALS